MGKISCHLSIIILLFLGNTMETKGMVNNTSNMTTYIVTTVEEAPWVIMSEDGASYKGFVVDVLDAVAERAGFKYKIHSAKDGKYGGELSNGEWSGMIGELVRQEADVAVGALTITDKRQTAIDFSKPFQAAGYRIMIKVPEVHTVSLKTLFLPFALEVWIMVMVICILVGAFLFIIQKFSPSEWSKIPEVDDPFGSRFNFTLKNCFFFVHSTLCWQGYKEAPRSPAGRILTTFWFSYCFMMIVAYTANLTAMLIARDPSTPVVPFKSFQEMATQTSVSYGTTADSSLYYTMKESSDPMYNRMLNYMSTGYANSYSFSSLVEKVRTSTQPFAAIVDSAKGEYVAGQQCDVMMVGELIFNYNMGFGCQKGSGLCEQISDALLHVKENGDVNMLRRKWWDVMHMCPARKVEHYISRQELTHLTFRPLTIADLSLAFLLLLIAFVLGTILLVVEVCVHRRREKQGLGEPVRMSEANGRGQSNEVGVAEEAGEKAPIAAAEP